MSIMSRREFLKSFSAGAVAVAGYGLLSAVAMSQTYQRLPSQHLPPLKISILPALTQRQRKPHTPQLPWK